MEGLLSRGPTRLVSFISAQNQVFATLHFNFPCVDKSDTKRFPELNTAHCTAHFKLHISHHTLHIIILHTADITMFISHLILSTSSCVHECTFFTSLFTPHPTLYPTHFPAKHTAVCKLHMYSFVLKLYY